MKFALSVEFQRFLENFGPSKIFFGRQEKKRDINIHNCDGDCPGGEGVSRPGGQGSNVYVLSAELKEHKHLVDVSDIFYFLLLGEGEWGSSRRGGGGGRFFIENPRRRGGLPGGWGRGGRGAGRVFVGKGGGGA